MFGFVGIAESITQRPNLENPQYSSSRVFTIVFTIQDISIQVVEMI